MVHLSRCLAILLYLSLSGTAAFAAAGDWHHTVASQHPLVGKIYATAEKRFLTAAELVEKIATYRYILLGEKHDNVDHHRLQARMITDLANAGTKIGTVGFEMLNHAQQGMVDSHFSESPDDVAGLADAVDWAGSGWPDFSYYLPIFETGRQQEAKIVALNLTRPDIRDIFSQGESAIDADLRRRSGLDRPFPPGLAEELEETLIASHCGHGNSQMIEKMIVVQRARDALMADRLIAAAESNPNERYAAVMIAGSGHILNNRGVPYVLQSLAPDAGVVSLNFQEVPASGNDESDLPDDNLSFDFVWFTPRVDNDDPCEKYKQSLEKMHKKN